jgi:hypothetical protein
MTTERLRTLFWDTNIERFEPQTYPRYTIERVLEHGDEEAVAWLLRLFTRDEIRAVLRRAQRRSPRSATFWALVFNVPPEDVAALSSGH